MPLPAVGAAPQTQLAHELGKLMNTCPAPHKDATQKDFEGFEQLFSRFINESGPSVLWDNIQKLPEAAVSQGVVVLDCAIKLI